MNPGGLITLDLNTRRSAWAVGNETDSSPRLGSWQLFGTETDEDLARSCAVLLRSLTDMCKLIRPRIGVYEAPIPEHELRGNTNYSAVRGLNCLSGVAMGVLINAGARVYPANIQRWRKEFLGHGFPKEPKQAALDQCAAYGWEPKNHDEADAAGIWHWGMFTHFKPTNLAVTPMFAVQKAGAA